jgi:hypothetical protein
LGKHIKSHSPPAATLERVVDIFHLKGTGSRYGQRHG